MFKQITLLSTVCCAAFISNCGGSKGSGNLVDMQDYWQLSGSGHQYWKSNCYINPQASNEFITTIMKFDATADFSQEDNVYSDAQCQNGLYMKTLSGTTKLTGKNEDVNEARDIEYKIAKADVKPTNQTGADYLVAQKFCGIVAWKNNEPISILGFDCRGNNISANLVIKDIVSVKSTSMYMGKREIVEGSALDLGRPNKLNRDVKFSKEHAR